MLADILALFRRQAPARKRKPASGGWRVDLRPVEGPMFERQGAAAGATRRVRKDRRGPTPVRRAGADGYLAAHGLEKSFGGRKVVRGTSLYVRRGEAVGLLGPNGAGKTTVFYMITGLVKPDRGVITLDGYDVTSLPMYRRARLGVGYLPQEMSVFRGLSVEDNIRAVLEIIEPDKGDGHICPFGFIGGIFGEPT